MRSIERKADENTTEHRDFGFSTAQGDPTSHIDREDLSACPCVARHRKFPNEDGRNPMHAGLESQIYRVLPASFIDHSPTQKRHTKIRQILAAKFQG